MNRFTRAAAFVAVPGPAVSSPVLAAPVHPHLAGQDKDNAQIVVDIFRLDHGKVVEHWDVMQDEVPAARSAIGQAMFPAR